MDPDALVKPAINLKIENRNSNFLTDQTPTPTTRLIKNCEEVGLFDDLKHVNPFDETFRRAVEESSTISDKDSSNTLTLPSSEDTLHTPHIVYNDTNILKQREAESFNINKNQLMLSKTLETKHNINPDVSELVKKQSKHSIKNKKVNLKKLRMLLPNQKQVYCNKIESQVISLNFHGQVGMLASSSQNSISEQSVNLETNFKVEESAKEPYTIKKKLKAAITKNNKVAEASTERKDLNDIYTSKNVQERKRAASMRYRKKKCKEVGELKKRNSELQSENILLKEKIKQLEHVLFTQHSNCTLTKQVLEKNPNGTLAEILVKATPAIHIPSSTILLNIPKIIIQQKGQVSNNLTSNEQNS